MLWICLLLPSLPLDVFARACAPDIAGRPFVVASSGRHPQVVAANAPARDAGIRRGQSIAAVLALAPAITLRERDPAAEAEALAEVATIALAFTPHAGLVPPDAVVAEIGGSLRLFGGLARLTARLQAAAQARGCATRIALAPTPLAASLLARAGSTMPAPDIAHLPDALAPLPLTLLDLDPGAAAALDVAGITTIGEVRRLPRAALARRFGETLVDALDHALGERPDPRPPYRPPPRFERRLPLVVPVDTVDALAFGVNRLVNDLADWLTARGLGVTRMSLALVHERHLRERGMPPTVVAFALAAAARAPAHLATVLRERLARVALPAPVEAIGLTGDATEPLAGRNLGLLPEDQAGAAIVPLIERLRARLADAAVVMLESRAEHRPEHAMRTVATLQGAAASKHAAAMPGRAAENAPAAARPLWLLDHAQPLGTVLEAQPWILRDGPERIESGWWDGRDLRRDYFVAETPQGEIVWIYRDHRYGTDDGEWFLHGLFA
ncbi:MAG: DNA polymerase Y family protein [Betaproteobacteria bacterium]|nr:DNA polymerase Y family protein [Betaproteobacteria bacterium]